MDWFFNKCRGRKNEEARNRARRGPPEGHLRAPLKSSGGQVAIILILVIAAALIFYAVSLNFGQLSSVKAAATIASNTSASMLASSMASYGQMLSETSLRGHKEKCALTGLVAAIVAAIIVIIAVILAAPTGGVSAMTAGQLIVSVLAITAAVTAVVLQAAVVQPGLTGAWNRITRATLSTRNNFSESAIQSALARASADSAVVPDISDYDGDRIWVSPAELSVKPYKDTVGRFGIYYAQRIKAIKENPAVTIVDDFIDGLREFLYKGLDGWGVHDPLPADQCRDAECHLCCVPDSVTLKNGEVFSDNRPQECENKADDAYWEPLCAGSSPYGADYPWVYDEAFENPYNNALAEPSKFNSLIEQIGRDDLHRLYAKNPADPNGSQALISPPLSPPDFHLEDATNYYVPPAFSPSRDDRGGVFPFFQKMNQWGVDLNTAGADFAKYPRECHWCDPRGAGCIPCADVGPYPHPAEIPQLALPVDPSALTYNTTYFVDGFDPSAPPSANPPLAADKITLPANIIAGDAVCAQDQLYPVATDQGFWKPGEDRFCSTLWPYELECPKHEGSCADPHDCSCGEGGTSPEEFPDDSVDDLVLGLVGFFQWAEDLLAQSDADLAQFSGEVTSWYPEAARWIEPAPGNSEGLPCFSCDLTDPPEGHLWVFKREMEEMRRRLERWKNNYNAVLDADEGYAGATCTQVWCVPPAQIDPVTGAVSECPYVQPGEAATFDFNGNGIRGDLEDVAACLDWNANDTATYPDGTTVAGNAGKFQKCAAACSVANCSDLPRSLVPGVNTVISDQDSLRILEDCRDNCNNANCQIMSPGYFSGDPGLTDFEAAQCATWAAGNVWYDEIQAALAPVCSAAWVASISQSALEAENQVAKFRKRADFLRGRLNEADAVIAVLTEAIAKFDKFLKGPAADFIDARINYSPDDDTGLPYQAVYGWQDEPKEGEVRGRWHIVKVEARLPGMCDNACGIDTATGALNLPDPEWPRITTRTKSWGTKRCYELSNTDGVVKFRTVRYDEEKASGSLFFPNGMPIWQIRASHPGRPQAEDDPSQLDPFCRGDNGNSTITKLPDGSDTQIYDGAFIMNKYLDSASKDVVAGIAKSNRECWNLAHKLLTKGAVSETCAKYFWRNDVIEGMDLMFIPCPEF